MKEAIHSRFMERKQKNLVSLFREEHASECDESPSDPEKGCSTAAGNLQCSFTGSDFQIFCRATVEAYKAYHENPSAVRGNQSEDGVFAAAF
ncbi:hypothetical protein SKAU_G00342310 [Synaphobranchus kaupii]|uniref:Uncharacterized protein n=1 Tax=Synaphobranchus kaupii TaxID=118154 RepID=A0A9Q1IIM6_SYNKA|nr:hypothetical protein SKAU_G00342310 [Synaphobranchus kaupii]